MRWALVLLGLIAFAISADAQSLGGMSGIGPAKGLGGGSGSGAACAGNLVLDSSNACNLIMRITGL
jgi:hypothetical protein